MEQEQLARELDFGSAPDQVFSQTEQLWDYVPGSHRIISGVSLLKQALTFVGASGMTYWVGFCAGAQCWE